MNEAKTIQTPTEPVTPSAAAVGSTDGLESRCECIDRLTKAIKAQFGERANLELELMANMKTGIMRAAFPPVYFKHPEIGKDGKPTKKMKRGHFKPNFCPLCGKAL